MRLLLHTPLSPFGRMVRLALAETGLEAGLVEAPLEAAAARDALESVAGQGYESFFEPTAPPFGAALGPVLVEDGRVFGGAAAIAEYLDETAPDGRALRLAPKSPAARAEARRLIRWSEEVFWREAVAPALHERLFKSVFGGGAPDATVLREAAQAARRRLAEASALIEARGRLAGEELGLADLALAAQVSVLDYLGARPFGVGEDPARDWYALIKSRPSFRGLLADSVLRLPPSAAYRELDF